MLIMYKNEDLLSLRELDRSEVFGSPLLNDS